MCKNFSGDFNVKKWGVGLPMPMIQEVSNLASLIDTKSFKPCVTQCFKTLHHSVIQKVCHSVIQKFQTVHHLVIQKVQTLRHSVIPKVSNLA